MTTVRRQGVKKVFRQLTGRLFDMKRAWLPWHPPELMFIGELERSGIELAKSVKRNPRREFHTVKGRPGKVTTKRKL
jgi:hypothetical protein